MNRELRIARAAGVLEGEGSFMNRSGRATVRVSCAMTDRDVLEELLDLFGGNLHTITKKEDHWKQAWVWSIDGRPAADCMLAVRPYMFSRRGEKIDESMQNWIDQQHEAAFKEDYIQDAVQDYLAGKGTYQALAASYGNVFSWETIRRRVVKR